MKVFKYLGHTITDNLTMLTYRQKFAIV